MPAEPRVTEAAPAPPGPASVSPAEEAATAALAVLLAVGERDRRQIARVVEAVEKLKNGPLLGILETYRKEHPDDHLALSTVIAEVQEIAAVLADEEDAK